MEIRKTKMDDLKRVMDIYAMARDFMAENGNPRQWGATNWPPKSLIVSDIEHNKSYVCVENDIIVGVFYFDEGYQIESTYQNIDGSWIGNDTYGVVHRIAVDHHFKGIGTFCLNYAFEQCHHLRIDTHIDNTIMQHVLDKLGFLKCGIIYVAEDNDPRIAYEKVK